MNGKDTRRVYLAFEFERDAQRRATFIKQSELYRNFLLKDLSLPSAAHDLHWQREAQERIRRVHVLIVLLGQDTHSSLGVRDELSLAGQVECPTIQLMPQHRRYGPISDRIRVLPYKWRRLNEMLQDPKAFIEG